MTKKRKKNSASVSSIHKLQDSHLKNWAIYIFSALVVIVGIALSLYYKQVAIPVRVACWLVSLLLLVAVLYQSQLGRAFFQFCNEAYVELLRVVWPGQSETIRMTLIVVVIVLLVSVVLWGFDSVLLRGMSLISR